MVAARNALHRSAKVRYGLLGAAAVMVAAQFASAGTFTWITASGTNLDWTSSVNWDVNGVPSNTAGDTVNVNANNTGNETINLNSAVTLGILNIGDTNATNAYTIAAGSGGGSLIFNNNNNGAQINESGTSDNDTISANIDVVDAAGLTITNTASKLNENLIISGAITSDVTITINVTGLGPTAVALQNANPSLQGDISIIAGILNMSGFTGTTNPYGTGTITLGVNGGTANTTLVNNSASITVTNDIVVQSGDAGTATLKYNAGAANTNAYSGLITLDNNLAIDLPAVGATLSGGITEQGSNALTLSLDAGSAAAATVSGLVTLSSGGLTIANNSTKTPLFTISDGVSGTGNLTLNANGGGGGITLSTAAINNTGTITNSGTGAGSTTISAAIGANVTGVIENSATSELILSDLTGANTFSGGVTISGGTVQAASGSQSTVLGSGNVTFGTAAAETLDLNSVSPTVGLLAGGSGSFGVITNNAATGTATLSLNGSGSQVFAGTIKDGSTAHVALTMNSGTQTLTGTNTYTGGTIITGGTLVAGSTGALGHGSVLVTGGTLEIDPAVVGTTSLTLSSPGTLKFDLGTDPTTSSIAGSGTYSLAGGTVDLGLGAGDPTNPIYSTTPNLLFFSGGSIGSISITDYDTADYLASIVDNGAGTAVLSFAPASVPEPASLMLLGLGAVGLLARRRRASERGIISFRGR